MPVRIERLEISDDDHGTDQTVQAMLRLIRQGANAPDVMATAAAICDRAGAANPYAHILAIREWCAARWCFRDDPDPIELLYAADTQLSMIDRHGCMAADCDDAAILFGSLAAARGFEVRVVCVAFLTPGAPYAHTWAECRPRTENAPWIEGDVTREMQEIPIREISRVAVWNQHGQLSGAVMARQPRCAVQSVPTDVGLFVSPVAEAARSGLGFTIPVLGIDTDDVVDLIHVGQAVAGVSKGGGKSADKLDPIWRNVQPTDVLAMQAIHARPGIGDDKNWYDTDSGAKLSTAEEDFRSSSLMADLIDAHIGGVNDGWYYDLVNQHRLTPDEAYQRFQSRFAGATSLEQALRQQDNAARSGGNAATPAPFVPSAYTPPMTYTPAGMPYTPPFAPPTPYTPPRQSGQPAYRPGQPGQPGQPRTDQPSAGRQPAAASAIPWKPIAIGAAALGVTALALRALSGNRR